MVVWSKDMKIKKSHLRRIIREEVGKVLSESIDPARRDATAAAIASIEKQFGKGSVMNLNTGDVLADSMRKQFGRAALADLDNMVAIHDELIEIGSDPSNTMANKQDLAADLIQRYPELNETFIHFHLNRFLQMPAHEISKVPSGAELKVEEIARREEVERYRRENPPVPRPEKPYGGGSRHRPWGRST
tara:strand:- start:105 stop:671 length:567 start_codon:yes stop_codon:yes gene_type:complete